MTHTSRGFSLALRLSIVLAFPLAVALSLSLVITPSARAEGSLVSVPGRGDVLYDDARGLLYVTAGDSILRIDPITKRTYDSVRLGGNLAGMDLSPDGTTLAIADTAFDGAAWGNGTCWIHLLDVDSGESRTVRFTREWGEAGTWMVAYAADGRLLVTSRFSGSGWSPMRRYDPATGQVAVLASVRQDTALAASGDRSIIGFAETNISSGAWGSYRASDGYIRSMQGYDYGTSSFNYEVATNRNGTIIAIPLGSMFIAGPLGRTSIPGCAPYGAEFSPTADVLYAPQSGTSSVIAYDALSWGQIASYDVESLFNRSSWECSPFWFPKLDVSADNALLFSTVGRGVRIVNVAPQVSGVVRSSAGQPIGGARVELWRRSGTSWSLATTRVASPDGSWMYSGASATSLKVRITDPSGAHAAAWVGGTSVTDATEFVSSRAGASADATLTLTSPATVRGTVLSDWDRTPVSGVEVALYRCGFDDAVVATTTSAADGTYSFGELASAEYKLGFVAGTAAFAKSYNDAAESLKAAPRIALEAGENVQRSDEIAFRPFKVQGSATCDFRSLPADGALAEIWRKADDGSYSIAETCVADASGAWTYESDIDAPVRVKLTDPKGMYADTWFGGTGLDSATDLAPDRDIAPRADVEMPVVNGGEISGMITSSAGGPLSGVEAKVYLETTGTVLVDTVITDADGVFRATGLGRGRYKLGFADPTGAHLSEFFADAQNIAAADALSVTSPTPVTTDATLTIRPSAVTGTVVSSSGGPVANAEVEIWRQASGTWAREATVAADGAGVWRYAADASTPVRLQAFDPSGMHGPAWLGGDSLATATEVEPLRDEPHSVAITLPLVNPGRVAGTVTSEGTGEKLQAIRATLMHVVDGFPRAVAATETNASGVYAFGDVGPGQYYVTFEDPTGRFAPVYDWHLTTVTSPQTFTYDRSMTETAPRLGGRMVSNAVAGGVPNGLVEFWQSNAEGALTKVGEVTSDADGFWSWAAPSREPVKVSFTDMRGFHASAWAGGDSSATAGWYTPGWSTSPVDVTLTLTESGSIAGVARDGYGGQPLAAIKAVLYDAAGAEIARTQTGPTGRYEFRDLAPGTYYVYFEDPSLNYWPMYYEWGEDIWEATPIEIFRPGRVDCSPYMEPYSVSWMVALNEPWVVNGSPAVPYVNEPVRIATNAFDAYSGAPISDVQLAVSWSTDGVTWTRMDAVDVEWVFPGQYEATVRVWTQSPMRFRFEVVTDDWYTIPVRSEQIFISPHSNTTSFSTAGIVGTGATSASVGYKGSTRFEAKLLDWAGRSLDGATIKVQETTHPLYDTWKDTTIPVENLVGGVYRATVSPTYKRYYRFVALPKGYDAGCSSDAVIVTPGQAVSAPSVSSTVAAGRSFSVSGKLWPYHGAGTRGVTLTLYRQKGSGWTKVGTYRPYNYRASGTTAYCIYKQTLKLSTRGTYKITSYAPADPEHGYAKGGERRFVVK